jgi:hypothetical protein
MPPLSQSGECPIWVVETNSFQLLEYAPKPRRLSIKLIHKESGDCWGFSTLGIEKERFEKCDPSVLESTFFLLANYFIQIEANFSLCSLWANLPYAFPMAEELDQFEIEEINTLKAIAIFINYGKNLFD